MTSKDFKPGDTRTSYLPYYSKLNDSDPWEEIAFIPFVERRTFRGSDYGCPIMPVDPGRVPWVQFRPHPETGEWCATAVYGAHIITLNIIKGLLIGDSGMSAN